MVKPVGQFHEIKKKPDIIDGMKSCSATKPGSARFYIRWQR